MSTGGFHAFINCTPVGMQGGPDPQGNPLASDVPLDETVTVMDTVYAPRMNQEWRLAARAQLMAG